MSLFEEHDPRFVHLERKVGIFVILGIAATVSAVVLLGVRQGVFTPRAAVFFRVASAEDLGEGAEVLTRGFRIGKVSRLRLDDAGKVEVRLAVDKNALQVDQAGFDGASLEEPAGGRGESRDHRRHSRGGGDPGGGRARLRAGGRPERDGAAGDGGAQAGPAAAHGDDREPRRPERGLHDDPRQPEPAHREPGRDAARASAPRSTARGRSFNKLAADLDAAAVSLRRDVLPAVAAVVAKADQAAAGAERTARAAESLVATDLRQLVTALRQELIPQVQAVLRSADGAVQGAGAATAALKQELPPILEKLKASLDTIQAITLDLKRASVQAPALLEDGGTLVQDSEALVKRVGGMWLCAATSRRRRSGRSMWTAISAENRAGCATAPRCGATPGTPALPGGRGWSGAGARRGRLPPRRLRRRAAGLPSAPLEREIELNRRATTAFERGQLRDGARRLPRGAADLPGDRARRRDRRESPRPGRRLPGPRRRGAGRRRGGRNPGGREARLLAGAALLRRLPEGAALRRRDALAEASRLAAQALALCRESACGNEGRIVNLQARIAFLAGDRAAALAAALEALALNREAKADEETANSLRIAADVHSVLGELAQAEEGYAAALVPGQEARPRRQDPPRSDPARRRRGRAGPRRGRAGLLPAGPGREPRRGGRAGDDRGRRAHRGGWRDRAEQARTPPPTTARPREPEVDHGQDLAVVLLRCVVVAVLEVEFREGVRVEFQAGRVPGRLVVLDVAIRVEGFVADLEG